MRMIPTRRMCRGLSILLIALSIAGCGAVDKGGTVQSSNTNAIAGSAETTDAVTEQPKQEEDMPCTAKIDWVDFLMINDIRYWHNYEGVSEVKPDQIGEKIGEVAYMLDGHACTDHTTKNGDAAFLPTGTPIYAMKGYRPNFRVIADNKIYEVNDNPRAKTMADLLDIDGKVEKVSLESMEDGSHIGDFTREASAVFMEELLMLPIVGFDEVYKAASSDYDVFLRVHLQDGTSLRLVFNSDLNAFTSGVFGTERLKATIITERDRIKTAAGM